MQTTSLPNSQPNAQPLNVSTPQLPDQIGSRIWDKTLAQLKQALAVVLHLTGIAILMLMLFASGAYSAILLP